MSSRYRLCYRLTSEVIGHGEHEVHIGCGTADADENHGLDEQSRCELPGHAKLKLIGFPFQQDRGA